MKAISVIVPNWNGERQLKKNLPLLFNVLKKFKGKSEVIIVDDASTDGSRKYLSHIAIEQYGSIDKKDRKKSIRLRGYKVKGLSKRLNVYRANGNERSISLKTIFNNRNVGFAESVNRGVTEARYDVVFLLNTDVEVKEGCFDFLLPHFEKQDVFAVGANADWTLGVGRFVNGYLDISSPRKISKKTKTPKKSFWVSGGHSAFDRKKWLALAGIDTLYAPFYFEETDLCYRAWKRGWQVLWEPRARVLHKHEESVIRKHFSPNYISFIAQRNQLIFIWKNITDKKMLREHKRNILKRIVSNPKYLKVVLAAALKMPIILKKRKKEEKGARRSDREIFDLFR